MSLVHESDSDLAHDVTDLKDNRSFSTALDQSLAQCSPITSNVLVVEVCS